MKKIKKKKLCWKFPGGPRVSGKEPACNARDEGSIPGLGRSLKEGHGNPVQYSCLENPMAEEPGGLESVESGLPRIRHY